MVSTLYPNTTPQTDGTAATTANLGAAAAATSGGVTQWEADDAKHGENGVWINQTGTSGSVTNRFALPSNAKVYAFNIENFRTPPSNPAANRTICGIRHSGGVVGSIQWGSTGNLFFAPTTGTNQVIAAAGVLAANTKYIVKILITVHPTTAASGSIAIKVYPVGSSTPTATLAPTTVNLGTVDMTHIEMGGSSVVGSFGYWRVQAEAGRTTELPEYVPEVALDTPVVTITDSNDPSTIGGTDGSITISWPAVSGAHHYEAAIADGTVTSGFTASDTAATSPKTFSGLDAGPYTVAVRAKAS